MADLIEISPKHCLKILVVDDDEMSRRLMRLLLVRDGHDVQLVTNGLEAVDAVKYQRFDIVFMDVQMPIMDGLEASRRIREWENGNFHTYIVALTASYVPEQGHEMFESGIDNYVSKPFEVDHIRHLLSIISKADHSALARTTDPVGKQEMQAVLDTETGIQRVGGDLNSYRELLNDFIQGLPGRITTLEQLFDQRDVQTLAREAHNLKGVSSNLGAWELSTFASQLDKQSLEGYTDQNRTLILDLKRAEKNLHKSAIDFLEKKDKIIVSS